MKITPAQKKAVVALTLLGSKSREAFYSRWDIGRAAKHDCSSYPMATMRALQRIGLAEPMADLLVDIVESGQCRCGCDRWRATQRGVEYVAGLKVVGAVRPKPLPTTAETKYDLSDFFGKKASQDNWWKGKDGPPGFDPGSDSQRLE